MYAPLLRIGFLDGFEKRVGHVHRYSTEEIVAKVKLAGFTIEQEFETEGFVRNFMYTSTIGTKVLLRIINRMYVVQRFFEILDYVAIRLAGTSDIIIVAKKK
ncbi:MAG: hypothetical protein UZ22_OP11002000478 [Microgenomates bacterium OLB23]|nr:MAG: hypothetical protein UZ22_OP11002000478 [Microgenomates bacterium OLB23]